MFNPNATAEENYEAISTRWSDHDIAILLRIFDLTHLPAWQNYQRERLEAEADYSAAVERTDDAEGIRALMVARKTRLDTARIVMLAGLRDPILKFVSEPFAILRAQV